LTQPADKVTSKIFDDEFARIFLDRTEKNCYFIEPIVSCFKKLNRMIFPMLHVKEHEEKLIKLYRRFDPEVREKILELMEIRTKDLKLNRRNGAKTRKLSVGEMIIRSLEDYLRGDYIVY
jgi:hypothetical protein